MTEPIETTPLSSPADGVQTDFVLPGAHGEDLPPYEVTVSSGTGPETVLLEGVNWERVTVGGVVYARIVPAPASGTVTRLRRTRPIQPTRFLDSRAFPARSTENAHDLLTRAVQDVVADAASAVRTPRHEQGLVMPSAADRAGRLLAFDGAGNLMGSLFPSQIEQLILANIDAAQSRATFANIAALKAVGLAEAVPGAGVTLAGRAVAGDVPEAVFVFQNGDQSAKIDADPLGIVYVAPDEDTTGESGAWRMVFDRLDIRHGGASVTLADNSAAIQACIDVLADVFGGGTAEVPDGTFNVTGPAFLRDNTALVGAVHTATIFNTRSSAEVVGDTAPVAMGSIHPLDNDNHTYRACGAITKGARVITPQTAAHVSDFQVGDVVHMIEGTSSFGDNTAIIPSHHEFNQIVAVSETTVTLKYPVKKSIAAATGALGVDPRGLWLANVSYRASTGKDAGVAVSRHVVRNARLANLTLGATIGGWLSRSGFFESAIEDVTVTRSAYGVFGNAWAHSVLRRIKSPWYTRAIEIKYGAHDTLVEDYDLYKDDSGDTSGGLEEVIEIGESARDIKLGRGFLDMGGHVTGSNFIAFPGATDCEIDGLTARGNGSVGNLIGFSTGIATRCRARNCNFSVGAVTRTISHSGENCDVLDCEFGDAASVTEIYATANCQGGKVSRNRFAAGDGAIELITGSADLEIDSNEGLKSVTGSSLEPSHVLARNLGTTVRAIRALGSERSAQLLGETTAPGATMETKTLTAGMLETRDTIVWKFAGQWSGTADVKNIAFDLVHGATTVTLTTYSTASGGSNPKWELEFEAVMLGATLIQVTHRLYVGGALEDQDTARLTIANTDDNDLTLQFRGWVDTAGDKVVLYRSSFGVTRPGFDTNPYGIR